MASEQVVRRDAADIAEEKEPVIEVTTVPSGATYMSIQTRLGEESKQRGDDDEEQEMATTDDPEYESLAEKVKGMDVGQLKEKMASSTGVEGLERWEQSEESMKKHESAGEKVRAMDEEGNERAAKTGERAGREESQLTLEEISNLRALAQQNSMEMLRAAEEKYNQAKEKTNKGVGMAPEKAAEAKGKTADGTHVIKEFAADKGSQAAQKAAEMRGKVAEGAQVAKEYAAEKGGLAAQKAVEAKDKVAEGALSAKEYATETGSQAAQKAVEAKDKAVGSTYTTAHYVAEKGAAAKDMILEKGQQGLVATKDTVVSAAVTAKDYTVPKVMEAKDKTMEATKGVVGYAGEKAVLAKDYTMEKAGEAKEKTVETGKYVAEYAGKVAADMKDKAVVVGWETAHYTTDKAVEGAKVAVGVVQGVAGKAREIAAKPLVVAKDMTAATAEKTKEYTARKKEEAEREYEAKKHDEKQQTGGHGDILEHDQGVTAKAEEFVGGGAEEARETAQGYRDIAPGEHFEQEMERVGAGVLGAIGETLIGIAETTKQMVIGPDDEPLEEEEKEACSHGTGLSTEERKANQ